MLLAPFYDDYTEARGAPPYDRRCHHDVAFMFMTAQAAPDFVAISRFRSRHLKAFAALFTQALGLCVVHRPGRADHEDRRRASRHTQEGASTPAGLRGGCVVSAGKVRVVSHRHASIAHDHAHDCTVAAFNQTCLACPRSPRTCQPCCLSLSRVVRRKRRQNSWSGKVRGTSRANQRTRRHSQVAAQTAQGRRITEPSPRQGRTPHRQPTRSRRMPTTPQRSSRGILRSCQPRLRPHPPPAVERLLALGCPHLRSHRHELLNQPRVNAPAQSTGAEPSTRWHRYR